MPPATSRKLFVNLPVADLPASVEFFTRLGFAFDQRFTDETATCMLVGEDAYVMLLTADRFADFTSRPTSDATARTEAIMAVAVDVREDVDRLAEAALTGGGRPAKEPMDEGFMYTRSFHDPDGHHWELFWMDPAALEG